MLINRLLGNKKNILIQFNGIVIINLLIFLYWKLGNGIPFLFDNNESFTTYLHAQNLLEYGFRYTAGLADESTSNFLEGHPFLYTHAGTFPRFISYLFLIFSIKSIEIHILLISILVVTISNLIIFNLMKKKFNSSISVFLVALINFNYIYIFQWNVNTWQVWKFLFFAIFLLICYKLSNRTLKTFYLLIYFMILFYYEHIYSLVFFLLILVFVFLVKNINKQKTILYSLIGIVISSVTLFMQNVYYSGLNIAIRDVYLTFIARNFTRNPNKFEYTLKEFYENNNILFWYNVPEYNPKNIFSNSIKNLFHEINNIGPVLSFLFILTLLILLFGRILDFSVKKFAIKAKSNKSIMAIVNMMFLLFLFYGTGFSILIILLIISTIFLLYGSLEEINVFRFIFFLAIFGIWLFFQLFKNNIFLNNAPDFTKIITIIQILIVYLILFTLCTTKLSFNKLVDSLHFIYSRKFVLSTVVIFIFMSIFFNGYINNGYLVRSSPFMLYFFVIFTIIPFVLIAINLKDMKLLGRMKILINILTGTIIFTFMQNLLTSPPNYLNEAEKILVSNLNSTFISNLHPAVVNYFSKDWAILNGSIASDNFICSIGSSNIYKNSYVWFADRNVNKSYYEPNYIFIYKNPPSRHFFGNVDVTSRSINMDYINLSLQNSLIKCQKRFSMIVKTESLTLLKYQK